MKSSAILPFAAALLFAAPAHAAEEKQAGGAQTKARASVTIIEGGSTRENASATSRERARKLVRHREKDGRRITIQFE